MRKFLAQHDIGSIDFLHNNCVLLDDVALCGTRGWFFERQNPQAALEEKVFLRELIRLEASLQQARTQAPDAIVYVFLHYPPIFAGVEMPQMTELLRRYRVHTCFYGHLHGHSIKQAFCGQKDGVHYRLISADAVGFVPIKIETKFFK